MRWQALFTDLEAQLEESERAELAAEVADRSRREVARLAIADRLRMAHGATVTFGLGSAGTATGLVVRVGPEWCLLGPAGRASGGEGGPAGRDQLVHVRVASWVTGLATLAADPDSVGAVESRLGLGYVLRVVARDRSAVRVALVDGTLLDGTIDRVGADFVDLAEHPAGEARRAGAVRLIRTVPFAALAVLRPS